MGREEPAAARPAAHREHGRGGLCSGEFPVWKGARAAPVGCMGREELRGGTGPLRNDRRALLGKGRTAGPPARAAAVRELADARPL
jgi:hypothetical protein